MRYISAMTVDKAMSKHPPQLNRCTQYTVIMQTCLYSTSYTIIVGENVKNKAVTQWKYWATWQFRPDVNDVTHFSRPNPPLLLAKDFLDQTVTSSCCFFKPSTSALFNAAFLDMIKSCSAWDQSWSRDLSLKCLVSAFLRFKIGLPQPFKPDQDHNWFIYTLV